MCLQCCVDARTLVEEIVPGFHLMVATKEADVGPEEWPAGWLGLVESNNPMFVWPHEPALDPFPEGNEDELLAALYHDQERKFVEYVGKIREHFVEEPNSCWRFVASCMRAGYDPPSHGDVVGWFVGRVNKKLADLSYAS